jgi:hypothetical protein
MAAVSLVVAWRGASARVSTLSESLTGGRLLVYFPDADLCCGAAEAESRGYLDVHNCPPWGTWVGFFADKREAESAYDNYLVAWVPRAFEELVSAGIAVNPEDCIAWLDSADVGLRDVVRVLPNSALQLTRPSPSLGTRS